MYCFAASTFCLVTFEGGSSFVGGFGPSLVTPVVSFADFILSFPLNLLNHRLVVSILFVHLLCLRFVFLLYQRSKVLPNKDLVLPDMKNKVLLFFTRTTQGTSIAMSVQRRK
ncbi:hypothetical protein V8G54_030719 [Vigna mungo]|uniref:Uncharacterized protein n=1 Tax=Vigna mungo TaxID=3915 RepID=A0AAQ3RKC9_VIGMU